MYVLWKKEYGVVEVESFCVIVLNLKLLQILIEVFCYLVISFDLGKELV